MSHRVENVVDEILVTGSSSYRVSVPRDHREVQIVLDRTRFERTVRTPGSIVRVEVWAQQDYLGGVEFSDLRIDATTGRPGQRMLWSFGRWTLPSRARNIDIRVRAIRDFNCLLHVDFF